MTTFLALIASSMVMSITSGGEALAYVPGWEAAVGIFFVSAAYIFDLSQKPEHVRQPILGAYLFRLFLLFFDIYGQDIYVLPNSGADSVMFFNNAVSVAYGGTTRRGLICELMGAYFKHFGISQLYGQFLLMLCSIVALHMAARIMDELKVSPSAQFQALWLVGLLPNFAILSSIFLRESIVTMLISISAWMFIKWFKYGTERHYILAFVFVVMAMRFHSGVVGVAVGYILARLLYNRHEDRFNISVGSILPAILGVLVFIYLFNNFGDTLFSKINGVSSIEDVANTNTEGGSSYAKYVGDSANPLNMILFTLPRMFYFIFSPLPWQWRGLSDLIAFFFSSMFYIATIVQVIRTMANHSLHNRSAVIILFIVALCTMFVFAWGTSNTGTAVRHREKMIIVYCVIWSLTQDVLPVSEEKTK